MSVEMVSNAPLQKEDKAGSQTWIIGGGAFKASDKVVQHNGCGTVNVSVSLYLPAEVNPN